MFSVAYEFLNSCQDLVFDFKNGQETMLVPPTVLNIFGFLGSVREPALTACNHVFPNDMAPNETGKYFDQITLNEK